MDNEKDFQEQILDILDKYNEIKDNPQEIHKIQDFCEELNLIGLYISTEVSKQYIIFSENKSEYFYKSTGKEMEYMKMATYNGKKMSSTYAKSLCDSEFREFKEKYIRAEGIINSLTQMLFQIGRHVKDMKDKKDMHLRGI